MTTFINQSVSADSIRNDKFTFDDVDGYYVNATVGGVSQNTITFGNGFEDSVTAAGTISNNKITFGDGGDDFVTGGTISNNTITFGDGVFDFVFANGDISGNTITFGDGFGGFDFVHAKGNISKNTITFGNGGDELVGSTISNNTITFGDGFNDGVTASNPSNSAIISNNKITFGDGDLDAVISLGDISQNTITFGNGGHDQVTANGDISYNTITFGDGDLDTVFVGGSSSHNLIIVGNGDNDQITLSGTATGADTIITGTGSFDSVTVGAHAKADTFGFSLGTNGTSFTTITGAQTGDHVAVGNSAGIVLTDPNSLGSTLIQASTTATDLASYISSLGALTNGDTYVGFNQTAQETFIVTETQSGQMGAVELVGHAFDHNSIAGNFLILA